MTTNYTIKAGWNKGPRDERTTLAMLSVAQEGEFSSDLISDNKCYTVPFQQHCGIKRWNMKIKSQHTHTHNIRASLCSWVYRHDNISHICLFLPLHRCCCVHLLWLFSSLSFSSRPPSSSCPCQAGCRRARPGHAERRSGPTSSSRPSGPESDGGTSHLAFVQANSIQIQKVTGILMIWVSHIWVILTKTPAHISSQLIFSRIEFVRIKNKLH